MKEIILKNIEKALLRIALSLEKKNTTQLNFKIDEKVQFLFGILMKII